MREKWRKRKGNNLERLCLGCHQLRQKRHLLRVAFVRRQGVRVDLDQRLGGRGAYICPTTDCLIAATKLRQWERGLKHPLDPKSLAEVLHQLKQHTLWMTGDLKRLWK
ncbi:MAG: DUF448 domain-containing protein [Candidatus Fervidibacterota bacterium]